MTRDFARGGGRGQQATTGGTPGWLYLVLGIAIGFAIAAGVYISRPTAPGEDVAAATSSDDAKPGGKKKITLPPKEPSRFAFYELLPNYEIVIPKEALRRESKKSAPAAAAGGDLYLIQVGSFRDRTEAEAQKARLALLGIESRIEQVTIDNAETWYRVRIGPEREAARVQNILAQLDENEIKALVMRVPD